MLEQKPPNGLRYPPPGAGCQCAGVDNAWEQEKLEARKMLVSRAESRQSTARCSAAFHEEVNLPLATSFFLRPNLRVRLHHAQFDISLQISE